MDNKQNRQFYWEVKDFMNKNPSFEPKKQQPNVLDAAKNILEQKNIFKQKIEGANSNTINNVSQVLGTIQHGQKGYKSSCKAFTSNNIYNPFNLNEQNALDSSKFDMDSPEGRKKWKQAADKEAADKEAEAYKQEKLEQMTADKARQEEEAEVEANRIERGAEPPVKVGDTEFSGIPADETNNAVTDKFKEAYPMISGGIPKPTQPTQPTQQPTQPAQTNIPAPDQERDKFKQERIKSFEKRNIQKRQAAEQQLAALNAGDESRMSSSMRATRAANRVRLQQEIEGAKDLSSDEMSRRAESIAKERFDTNTNTTQADYMAARMKELSAKNSNELTSAEAGELSLFKTMMGGKVATPGLEQRVRERFTGARGQQGPTPDGGNLGTEDADYVFSQTVGRSQEDLVNQSQQAGAREAAQKAAEQAEFDKKQAEQKRASMQNVRIQGTNMTYGEFETQYGRPYDALNREDSTMLVRAASNRSASRVSPTARALDQTTVDFNRTYRDINAQNAAREGELDRRVDSAKISLDQFNADRRGTVQREISRIQAQPGFVRNVAQSMSGSQQSSGLNTPSTTTQVNSIAGRMMGLSPTQKIGGQSVGQMTAQAMVSGTGNILGNQPLGNLNVTSQQTQTKQANDILKFLQGK